MKLPLWHRQLKSLCAVTDFNPVEQNCCSSVTHSQAALSHRLGLWGETACTCTVSGTALARSWKQRVPFPPSAAPHLEEGHTEISTLPQVEQLAFLHLASFADLQEEPGLTIPPWLPTTATDCRLAAAFLSGAAAQARNTALHSNSISATLSFSTEKHRVQSCTQWSWERNRHWDEVTALSPTVHTTRWQIQRCNLGSWTNKN